MRSHDRKQRRRCRRCNNNRDCRRRRELRQCRVVGRNFKMYVRLRWSAQQSARLRDATKQAAEFIIQFASSTRARALESLRLIVRRALPEASLACGAGGCSRWMGGKTKRGYDCATWAPETLGRAMRSRQMRRRCSARVRTHRRRRAQVCERDLCVFVFGTVSLQPNGPPTVRDEVAMCVCVGHIVVAIEIARATFVQNGKAKQRLRRTPHARLRARAHNLPLTRARRTPTARRPLAIVSRAQKPSSISRLLRGRARAGARDFRWRRSLAG